MVKVTYDNPFKRYVVKVYKNKLLEHSQYSLQFSQQLLILSFFSLLYFM